MKGRRLVLDSCCFQGASRAQLESLRSRGFRISVSALALMEVWAKAARTEQAEFIAARARTLSSYIDRSDPVVPTGVQLVARLGGSTHGTKFTQPDHKYETGIREVWRWLTEGKLPAEALRRSGLEANAEIDELAKGWVETGERIDPELRQAIRPLQEDRAIVRVASWLVDNVGRDISLKCGVQERLHGYFRLVALHAVRAAAGTHRRTTENDSEDVQLLMHLADDVVLVTSDVDLIARVDDTGSFQAPYIRTIGELLALPIPPGPPWGRTARRAAGAHTKRSRTRLNELDQASRTK
jgi:hypothetical protein